MRILVTGGAGFIGSHLAERLLGQGHEVSIVDISGDNIRRNRVRGARTFCMNCRDYPRSSFIPSLESWHSTIGDTRPDFIYHLAAIVGVKRVLEDPKECIENNVQSLSAVLSLGIPGLFTSTSEVYGLQSAQLQEDSPLVYSSKPRWSYAASKLVGEWMALQAGWKVVRLFNVVGPRQSSEYGAVLPNFVRQALAGEPLTVYGYGDQVRTFIDVRDCVEILDRLREKEFDVVNVGGVYQFDIAWLANEVIRLVAPDMSGFKRIPYTTAYGKGFEECPSRIPDLTKLDSLLPERPYTKFSNTIRDLVRAIKPTLEESKCLSQTT